MTRDRSDPLHQVLARHPPDAQAYLRALTAALDSQLEPPTPRLTRREMAASAAMGAERVAALNRDLIGALARVAPKRIHAADLPAEVVAFVEEDLARITADVAGRPPEHFTFARYRFKADCRIAALRRLPLGMWDVEVGGIPLRLFLRQPPRDAVRLLAVVVAAGGTRPFFRQHMTPYRMRLFSPAGREQFLKLVAEMLRRRPHMRGLISSAWFNDPRIREIAPHLAYLPDSLERLGGRMFRVGTAPDVVEDALANSFERQRLYRAGRWVPTAYMGVAPRRRVLEVYG